MSAPQATEAGAVLREALVEIRRLKARLRAAEAAARAPIAVVGMGLRLPGGVASPEDYDHLLRSGRSAISEVPEDRWQAGVFDGALAGLADPGAMRFGGFLDDLRGFDNGFFGISPREADCMDPQQRLTLEVSWHALEHAAIAPAALRGSKTGVYLGIAGYDYGRAIFDDPETVEPHFSTGTLLSVAAGRLAYVLGTQGPAVAIDTACSSSLVALHLACQGLRAGECDLALAGGVNAILSPEIHLAFAKGGMLAPDGHCKSFDAAADGYVRSEGCGMLVLRRLEDATASGDRILGVILGSATNHDGRSGGLTAPNGPAQEAVIRAALAAAGTAPDTVAMVEAHGTGTPLGDPIEMGALAAVYGAGRDPERPLLVGSAKSVVGHLEAAAGVAGVAKALLALRRREMPGNLHFENGNPNIDWSQPVAIPTEATPLTARDGALVAAVSSFGISGTNAHMILSAPPAEATEAAPIFRHSGQNVLAISAESASALTSLARGYIGRLEQGVDADALCATAAIGRSHFRHRLAITNRDADALRHDLEAVLDARPREGVALGHVDGVTPPRLAFLFSGQGGLRPGMARALMADSKVFRDAIARADAGLGDALGVSIAAVLRSEDAAETLARTEIAQPVQIALQCALHDLWRSYGIVPDVVLGHSLGELAAAYAAGVWGLEDAVRAAAARGSALAALPPGGAMASVSAAPDLLEAALAASEGRVTIAAFNGRPGTVSLSGEASALRAAVDRLEAGGARVRGIDVPFAAHSAHVDAAVAPLQAAVSALARRPARLPIISSVTGTLATPEALAAPEYWGANLRQPVRFSEAVAVLAEQGLTHALELGPHPALIAAAAEGPAGNLSLVASLHRDRPDWEQMFESLGRLYADGAEVDWRAVFADAGALPRPVDAPSYPFERSQRWVARANRRAGNGWDAAVEALVAEAERGPLDIDMRAEPAKQAYLARVTVAVAAEAFASAGLFDAPDVRLDAEAVAEALDAPPLYHSLIRDWLRHLEAAGLLARDQGAWSAAQPLPVADWPAIWAEGSALFAEDRGLFDYVRHCAALAGEVIRGKAAALETLFPNWSFDLAEGLYERSAAMRYVNGLAGAVVAALGSAVGDGRRLRVLEAGAGTGGTTAALLARAPVGQVDYQFTDVSSAFLDRARERFGARGDVGFGLFDLEKPPADQGHADASFDLIVAANALHAVRDLPLALRRLHDLLRPGGVLMLVETTKPLPWFDITTGLIEGWRHFEDTLRRDSPLLSPDAWCDALRDAGYAAAEARPGTGSQAEAFGQHVILGRRAGGGALGVASAPVAAAVTPDIAVIPALRATLDDAPAGERLHHLRSHAAATVARVLGLGEDALPGRHERLTELGLDSLMALRLRSQLAEGLDLGAVLPASIAYDCPTVEALAQFLHERLYGTGTHPTAAVQPLPQAGPATDISEFTDAEVEALLIQKLGRT